MARQFPVLMYYVHRQRFPDARRSIPWELVAPYERRALRNHNQTLERLAERGGLNPPELVCLLEDRSFRDFLDIAPAIVRLEELITERSG